MFEFKLILAYVIVKRLKIKCNQFITYNLEYFCIKNKLIKTCL
jgi:hypothetical protein